MNKRRFTLIAGLGVLLVLLPLLALGDSSTVVISGAGVTVDSTSSSTMDFPVSRSGDTSFDAFVQYQTQDGTAVAGTDYTAASGSLAIPAGQNSATIPVTIAGSTSSTGKKTFEMQLLGGGGGSFTASFAPYQDFGVGDTPTGVAVADLNGDGKPDLIVANPALDEIEIPTPAPTVTIGLAHSYKVATTSEISGISVLLNTTTPGSSTPSFSSQQVFSTGGTPEEVVVADLNGDGKPDLIAVNRSQDTVSVLLNTTRSGSTTLSFAAAQNFATGNGPISVAAADLNGDGKPDLVVANQFSNTVSVLMNSTTPGSSTPSFTTAQNFAVGSEPNWVTVADVNGDGKFDLITANIQGENVSVLLNTTAPDATTSSFAAEQNFAAGFDPVTAIAVDVNGDGKPDLIVVNQNLGTLSVLLNQTTPGSSTPSFATRQGFNAGTLPYGLAAADVNGDGKPDLIVANATEDDDNLSVLLNTTAPGATTLSFTRQMFNNGTLTNSTAFLPEVAAADLNGDGRADLILVNPARNDVTVLLNTTASPSTTLDANSFGTGQAFSAGNNSDSAVAADLNGDGKPDLVVANQGSNSVSVLLNTTSPGTTVPAFASHDDFPTGSGPLSVAVGDINADGLRDLVVVSQDPGELSVLLNQTTPGSSTPSFATLQSFATGSVPDSVAVGDLNGDGLPDLAVANFKSNTVSVFFNQTTPGSSDVSLTSGQDFSTGSGPTAVAIADVNGDGLPDLVIANGNANTVSVLFNQTTPGSSTARFASHQDFASGDGPAAVALADINGDGLPDLVTANGGANTVSVLFNRTTPGSTIASFISHQDFATGQLPQSVAVADVNGDGKLDLIATNFNANTMSVLLNQTTPGSTTASFGADQNYATGSNPLGLAVADVNGDGAPDLLSANFGGNSVSVLLNSLYRVVLSGSPATGTIHYTVPSPIINPVITPTPSASPAEPTPSASSTVTPTPLPTPVPGAVVGTVTAPAPVKITGAAGQIVAAGSFTYTNSSASPVQIGAVTVSASQPASLASLTLSENGSSPSVTISSVAAVNVFELDPPLLVGAGAGVSFSLSAVTAGGTAAAEIVKQAGIILAGRGSLLGCGLLAVGLMMVPMDRRRRHASVVLALLLVAAVVSAAGCSGGSSAITSATTSGQQQRTLSGTGQLSSPLTLSEITVSGGTSATTQQLTAFGFK